MFQKIRSDLTSATALYYPLLEIGSFADTSDLADRLGISIDYLEDQITQAKIECSDLVILEYIAIGNPEDMNRAVLQLSEHDNGGILFCGIFSSMSEDHSEVVESAEELSRNTDLQGRTIAIGEHRKAGSRCYS